MKKCKQCGKEWFELDPIGPEQVNSPMYTPDCECEGEQDEIREDSTSMEEKFVIYFDKIKLKL